MNDYTVLSTFLDQAHAISKAQMTEVGSVLNHHYSLGNIPTQLYQVGQKRREREELPEKKSVRVERPGVAQVLPTE